MSKCDIPGVSELQAVSVLWETKDMTETMETEVCSNATGTCEDVFLTTLEAFSYIMYSLGVMKA